MRNGNLDGIVRLALTLGLFIEWRGCVSIPTQWDESKDEGPCSGKLLIDGRTALVPEKAKRVCRHYEGVRW